VKHIALLIIVVLFFSIIPDGNACKVIVAVGDSTEGNYNLILKVRNPSRLGFQVLTIINQGDVYHYHHPWTGKEMQFLVNQSYIGTVTKGDSPPNITKPGMALSKNGIAYADADSPLFFVNPTRHAWDDFDWIRYACERASTEEEAVDLLTDDVIDNLHAPGLGENLFVVGPQKGYVIESDAFKYTIQEIQDIYVQSNYPKTLWKRSLYPLLIGSSFTLTKDIVIREKRIVRLSPTFMGVKIIDIQPDNIVAKQFPFGEKITISLGDTGTVGEFRVQLLDITGKTAFVSLSYQYLDWEIQISDLLYHNYGHLDVQDLIHMSRLHNTSLDGLRGMCEGGFEAAAIYKIPFSYPDILSSGWFAPNQCSWAYVPFHICNQEIYTPYQDGTAHMMAQELLQLYGHGTLTPLITNMENIFLLETERVESHALSYLRGGHTKKASDLLTVSDLSIQKQGFIWESILYELTGIGSGIQDTIFNSLNRVWTQNYLHSLSNIQETVELLTSFQTPWQHTINSIIEQLLQLALNITECKINQASIISNVSQNRVVDDLEQGRYLFNKGEYDNGFRHLSLAYHNANNLILGANPDTVSTGEHFSLNIWIPLFFAIAVLLMLPIIYKKIK
jgi:hypothetical protein